MIRVCELPVALFITAMMALAADQSPEKKSDEPDSFDIEPPILKQNLSALTTGVPSDKFDH
jgi:hypothetical protein